MPLAAAKVVDLCSELEALPENLDGWWIIADPESGESG